MRINVKYNEIENIDIRMLDFNNVLHIQFMDVNDLPF